MLPVDGNTLFALALVLVSLVVIVVQTVRRIRGSVSGDLPPPPPDPFRSEASLETDPPT